jgi:hypothetical protein
MMQSSYGVLHSLPSSVATSEPAFFTTSSPFQGEAKRKLMVFATTGSVTRITFWLTKEKLLSSKPVTERNR